MITSGPGNFAVPLNLSGKAPFFQGFLEFAFIGLTKIVSPALDQASPIETVGT